MKREPPPGPPRPWNYVARDPRGVRREFVEILIGVEGPCPFPLVRSLPKSPLELFITMAVVDPAVSRYHSWISGARESALEMSRRRAAFVAARFTPGGAAGTPKCREARSANFDPMLAKLIAYAPMRDAAIDRLDRALRDSIILGVTTNISWLRRVIEHRAFREGKVSTRFLIDHEQDLQREVPEIVPLIASALAQHNRQPTTENRQASSIWNQLGPWGRT